MKLAPGTPLSVSLTFDPSTSLPIARLAMEKGIAQLEWSIEVLDRGLAISPLNYSPEPGLHAANGRTFNGLHGFLSDSLPEQWGYLVLRKRLAKLGFDIASLSPLDLLALVGNQGRGALVFEPATTPSLYQRIFDGGMPALMSDCPPSPSFMAVSQRFAGSRT